MDKPHLVNGGACKFVYRRQENWVAGCYVRVRMGGIISNNFIPNYLLCHFMVKPRIALWWRERRYDNVVNS
ncbi:MAG: hypothetical protein ACPLQP_07790 [Moorellaceae bacterium]